MNQLATVRKTAIAQRERIEQLQCLLEEGVETGELVQTVHNGLTEAGQDQCQHFWGDGIYCRGLWIPQGTVVVGLIHRQARICTIAAGECSFFDEYQRGFRVKAPWVGEFKGGCKTAVIAHKDTYWIAALGTEMGDRQSVMEDLCFETYDDLNAYMQAQEKDE